MVDEGMESCELPIAFFSLSSILWAAEDLQLI